MKKAQLVLSALILCCLASAFPALADGHGSDANPYKITIDDAEAVDIAEAIKAYVYTVPPDRESIKLFDRKKGEIVKMKFDKIVLEDGCVHSAKEGYMAVCAAFTGENGDDYVVWFILEYATGRQEAIVSGSVKNLSVRQQWTVRDVIVKSCNGQTYYEWKQTDDGFYVPKDVPAPEM